MSLTTMYPAVNNSPRTTLTAAIDATDTSMTLADASVLPSAPNLAVLGNGTDAEIVSYTAISGNVVSGLVRGINNTTAKAWDIDTIVARNFTAADHEAFRENILDLQTQMDSHTHDDRYYTETEVNAQLATKANSSHSHLASDITSGVLAVARGGTGYNAVDTTPTSGSSKMVTSGGVYTAVSNVSTAVTNKILYFYQQSVSAATSAQIMRIPASGTNSAITTDTIVLECTFATPANITSNVTWTSYAGYITFTGTCTAGTTANVTLGTKGN